MEKIFLSVVNMSASATWLLLAVLLLRLVLKRAPRRFTCALWALVGIRLAMPFSIEAPFSLLPSAEVFPEEFLYAAKPEINSGIEFVDNSLNPIIAAGLAPSPMASANPTQINAFIFALLWVFVASVMLIYMAMSFIRIKLRVREAVSAGENVWLCDRADTPFILGVIRPKIYLPSDIEESDAVYVTAHEKAHIKRLDYIWKPLGFLLLAVHWFNPAVWLAYVLFCRDIEFACDEKVIRELGDGEKKAYSHALLNLSVPKHMISACPLAFGEVGVKERIKSVLNYKKPAFRVVAVSVLLVIAMAVGFLTSPTSTDKGIYGASFQKFVDEQIMAEYDLEEEGHHDWEIIGSEKNGTRTTIYAWVMVTTYYKYESTPYSASYRLGIRDHTPTVIVIDGAFGIYSLTEYWRASESYDEENDIKAKFPEELWEDAFNSDKYRESQYERCKEKAPRGEHYGWIT